MQRIHRRTLQTTQSLLRKFNARDHIEETVLPTFHFQGALPRLPVPDLDQSLDKYVDSLEALEGHPNVSSEDIERVRAQVQEFRDGIGSKLHSDLKAMDTKNSNTSFYYADWTNMYLSDRRPLPVNYNPVLHWKNLPNPALNEQSIRAAQYCWAAAKYYLTLRDGHLKPEVFYLKDEPSETSVKLAKWLPKFRISIKSKGIDNLALRYLPYASASAYPLDMTQISNLLYSTRIPTEGKDIIKKADEKADHVIVLSNGRFYTLDVLRTINDRHVRDPLHIFADLENIIKDSKQKGNPKHPVAMLSNVDRDTWTSARKSLIDLGNEEALKAIDDAMFCLSLDDHSGSGKPPGVEDADLIEQFLWGPGHNRWVDKSFSIIVTSNGESALNFEHAWGDGACVLSFFNKIHEHIISETPIKPGTSGDFGSPQDVNEVHFVLDKDMETKIDNASEYYRKHIDGLVIDYAKNTEVTRKWMVNNKLGADGFLQLSLQIAHNEIHGWPCAHYESASTCAYHNGRTETIRPCTREARNLCDIYSEHDFENPEFQSKVNDSLRKAIKTHNTNMADCLQGQGFDRHLFGLRQQCVKQGIDLPDFVKDPTFSIMNHFRLSTSTLNSENVAGGGFGPVVDDGYAVGYMVFDDFTGVVVISKPSNGVDSNLFSSVVQSVWDNLKKCVEGSAK